MLTEEELIPPRIAWLSDWLRAQPPWSDLPIIVFSSLPGDLRLRALGQLQEGGNVSFVDRPVQRRTFLAAIRSALRARERQYESRRAIEARDQFLAMLGHELRNPLSAVRFATDLIMRQNVPDPWIAKHAATIERQTAHLNRLVDDLLDVSRVTSGKVILRKERTDLALLTARCLESLHGMAVAHGVALARRPEAGTVVVDGDAVRLEQVICNLLTNAIKYTPRGGHIDVTVSGRSGAAVMVVRDDGIGIPTDQLEAIFEVFNQAPTSLDRTKGGLGLGLALVRALVNMHGGTVQAHSDGPGKGSTFTVTLPMVAAPAREAQAHAAATAAARHRDAHRVGRGQRRHSRDAGRVAGAGRLPGRGRRRRPAGAEPHPGARSRRSCSSTSACRASTGTSWPGARARTRATGRC